MKQYTPKETNIVGQIKKQFEKFIEETTAIDTDAKKALLEDLGWNWYDQRFSATQFIPDAIGYAVSEWKEQNFKLSELWKQIAIANAAVSNTPYDVANATVEEFKKQFNIEE